jgi:hypothetical protein
MLIHAARPLFAWSELEDSPSLQTIRAVLSSLDDQPLLDGLRRARGQGRNDYPVGVLWGVVVVSVLCRHVWLNDCLAELHRNPTLCRILGITKVADIPGPHNLSRFLDLLGQPAHLQALRGIFDALVKDLGGVVPDLGRHTAGDSTALAARPKKSPEAVAAEVQERLPQPTGGRKEYHDDDGKVVKAYEWILIKDLVRVQWKPHPAPPVYPLEEASHALRQRHRRILLWHRPARKNHVCRRPRRPRQHPPRT